MCLLMGVALMLVAGCDDGSSQKSDGDTDLIEDGDVIDDGDIIEDGDETDIDGVDIIVDGDDSGDEDLVDTEIDIPSSAGMLNDFSAAGGIMQGQGMVLLFSFAPVSQSSVVGATNGSQTLGPPPPAKP